MNIKLPIVAGVVGIGGSAAGLGIYLNLDNRETISSLIFKEPTHVLLSNKDKDADWNEAGKKYRGANKDKALDTGKIKNFSSNIASETAIDGFKEACSLRYENKVDGIKDSRYVNVKEGCTRSKKIFELLSTETDVTLLSKDNSDSTLWNTAGDNYKKAQKPNDSTDAGSLSDGSGEKGKSEAPNSFKEKCKIQSEASVIKGKEDILYIQVKNGCTTTKKI